MKKILLFLVCFAFTYHVQAQCGPGQDTTAPVFGDAGDGTMARPFRSLASSVVGGVPSGRYYFSFDGNTFQGELDNDTDGGGWLMILNYVHVAGDNSNLTVRNTDLPLLGSSTLGDNEAGTANWGHFGNQLAAAIDFEEVRFYGVTTGHSRVINFKTSYQRVLDYVKTGTGSFDGINGSTNHTVFADHTAFIPAQGFNEFNNQGDLALTNFPFWAAGSYHWGIRGGGSRWEVDDFAVNAASTIHRVWVRGDLSPAGGNEITVQLDTTGNISITPADFDPIAIDNCGTVNFSLSQTDFDCTMLGANVIQLIATDDQGNSTPMDVTVNVEDVTGPEINITADLSIPFDLDPMTNTFTLTAADLGLTTPDNCGLQSMTISQTDFDCSLVGFRNITITATDINNNETVRNVTVRIRDTIDPILNCVAPFTIFLDEQGEVRLTPEDLGTFSDNCTTNAWLSRNFFNCSNLGDNTVTLFVQDNWGNEVSCDVVVTIDVACPTDMIVDNDPNACGAIVNYTNPSCYTLISGLDSGEFYPLGTTTNVIEITDASGTTSQCTFDVTVRDTQAPLYIAQDQVVVLDATGTITLTQDDLIGVHPSAPQYQVETSGTFAPVDISAIGTEITLGDDQFSDPLAFDFIFNFYGNQYTEYYISSNGFISFSGDDNGCCSGDRLPDTDQPNNLIAFDWNDVDPGNGGTIRYATIGTAPNRIAIVDFDAVEHNNSSIDPTTVQVKMFESSNRIEIHATSIPSTAASGQRKTQGVENFDGTRAVPVPGRNSTIWSATNDYVAFVPSTGAYDNCGIDTIQMTNTTFDCTSLGMNQVDITITDVNGNISQQTATVNVTTIDNTPPAITLNGDNPQIIELGDGYAELGATTDDGSPVMIDASAFQDVVGSYQIVYNAADALCNDAEVIRIVIVQDTTAPIITLNGDNPQIIELGDGYTELGATTDDGSPITIDSSDFQDAVGSYVIHYNATDANGNDAIEVTRMVEVVDTTAPVITLNGDNPQIIELGSGYTELGAATDDGSPVMIDSSDFADVVGSYTIRYNATDANANNAIEVTRTVEVVDTMLPVITLNGVNPQIIELGTGYVELGATTDDGSPVMIDSSDFVDAVGSYTIRYNATDANGNSAVEVTRSVEVVDTTAPVITLLGANPQFIDLGTGYVELGATTDDGSQVVIDANDFVDVIGTYSIRYNATDASGNMAVEVIRTVEVVDFCALDVLPSNNFEVIAVAETCVDKDNGIISINTLEPQNYIVTVGGDTHHFNSSVDIHGMSPGSYTVCISIDGFAGCEQCFELAIGEAATLAGKADTVMNADESKVAVAIESGTPPFLVKVNDQVIGEYASNDFEVAVVHGDVMEVSSSVACEGTLSKTIDLFDEISVYPNPTKSNVSMNLPATNKRTIGIQVRNALGMMVMTDTYSVAGNRVNIPMQHLPTGIYFINVEGSTKTFKIIKE